MISLRIALCRETISSTNWVHSSFVSFWSQSLSRSIHWSIAQISFLLNATSDKAVHFSQVSCFPSINDSTMLQKSLTVNASAHTRVWCQVTPAKPHITMTPWRLSTPSERSSNWVKRWRRMVKWIASAYRFGFKSLSSSLSLTSEDPIFGISSQNWVSCWHICSQMRFEAVRNCFCNFNFREIIRYSRLKSSVPMTSLALREWCSHDDH